MEKIIVVSIGEVNVFCSSIKVVNTTSLKYLYFYNINNNGNSVIVGSVFYNNCTSRIIRKRYVDNILVCYTLEVIFNGN